MAVARSYGGGGGESDSATAPSEEPKQPADEQQQQPPASAASIGSEWCQVEVIELVNNGSGLGFGIIGELGLIFGMYIDQKSPKHHYVMK